MDITVTIPTEGKRVLESWLGTGGIQIWLQNAIDNKLRQRVDACILEETDKNPAKMNQVAKLAELKGVTLPTKTKRNEV